MSQKKSTTLRKHSANKPARAELRKQLARNMTPIFANPETPVRLYNALAEGKSDLFNAIPTKHLDEV